MIDCFPVEEVDHGGPAHHWIRTDTGAVLPARSVGSMWWTVMTERRRPKAADDYARFTRAELDRIREVFAQHPTLYPGPLPGDPTLPARQPSYTFRNGKALWVQTPGGSWCIDSRASNCGSPYDYEHRCWVRHGDVPVITVDKIGRTCSAGAGSILCGKYHGFLRNGRLVVA